MYQKISLNGSWQCQGEDSRGNPISFPGTVPGCVHTDLIRHGLLPADLFWRDNALSCQWVESKSFRYSRRFVVDDPGANPELVFEGLDTFCEIYLNHRLLGRCFDMFLPYTFSAEGILKKGENLLEVIFFPPAQRPLTKNRKGAFSTQRLECRRMQCTYGWDWVERFVTMGIYRPVYLRFSSSMTLAQVYLYTKAADAQSAQEVAELSFLRSALGGHVDILVLSPKGQEVCRQSFYCEEPSAKIYLDILSPALWMPNGWGRQPLYELQVRIDGQMACVQKFGIVTARILQAPDAPDSDFAQKCRQLQQCAGGPQYDKNQSFSGFQLLVNGRPVFCKGANWVPCEPFPSAETPEKITALLELAKAAGINMLRVWGGGIFEQDFFYDECDRLGIMVTQDFMMACGEYPEEDPSFLEALRQEARAAALRLRNHPCLMWWTGDNENAVNGFDLCKNFPGRTVALKAIAPVLCQYDPQRRFLLSSPWGGNRYASKTAGTTHNTQFLGTMLNQCLVTDDYKEYLKEFTARFIAEEPCLGAAEETSLRQFMTWADILETEDIWRFHTKTNPALSKEIFDYIKGFAENIFGPFCNGRDRLMKLKYLQYEWIRVSMENARRNQGFCGGILYWMLNDCWPAAAGWALLDYYARPKAGYYSFRRCAKPVMTSIDREGDMLNVYLCNDSPLSRTVRLSVHVLDYSRHSFCTISTQAVLAAANTSCIVTAFPLSGLGPHGLLISELRSAEGGEVPSMGVTGEEVAGGGGIPGGEVAGGETAGGSVDGMGVAGGGSISGGEVGGGEIIDRAFYKQGNLRLSQAVPVDIAAQDANHLTLVSDHYLHLVCCTGGIFEDNYFFMMPGETRTISYRPLADAQPEAAACLLL